DGTCAASEFPLGLSRQPVPPPLRVKRPILGKSINVFVQCSRVIVTLIRLSQTGPFRQPTAIRHSFVPVHTNGWGGWIGVRPSRIDAGRALVTVELGPRDLVYAEGERVAEDDAVDSLVVVAVCLSRGRAHEKLAGGADDERQSIATDRIHEPRS